MMTASFVKYYMKRAYPYLAERTDGDLTNMIVIFIALDKALKINAHTIEVVHENEQAYTPIQGTIALTFGGEGQCLQGGGPILETRGPLL